MDWKSYPGLKPQAEAAMESKDDSRKVEVRGTAKADPSPKEWELLTDAQRDELATLYRALARIMSNDVETVAQPIVDAVTDEDVRKIGQAWIDATIIVRDAARS